MSTSLPCFTEPCFIGWAVSLGGGTSLQNSCRGYYVPCNRLLHFSLTAHQSKALLGRGGVDAEWDYSRTYVNGYLSTTATPTNACPQLPNCQNNLLTTGSFFSATDEKVRNVHEWIRMHFYDQSQLSYFDLFFHVYCCSKQKMSTILIANVANLARFATLEFWFKG